MISYYWFWFLDCKFCMLINLTFCILVENHKKVMSNEHLISEESNSVATPVGSYHEPSFKTRRELKRTKLAEDFIDQFHQKEKLTLKRDEGQLSLKAVEIVNDAEEYQSNCKKYPLYGRNSEDFTIWSQLSQQKGHHRRVYEITKPNSEYFGDKQWR